MIGRLTGVIQEKKPPAIVLDVNGVGYELEAPMTTFYDLPALGERVTLFTHMAVREDAHLLYAFCRETDRALFRHLIKVSGVGGKLALALLSGMTAEEFVLTIRSNDVSSLTRIPGVGKKTAERLVIELRDRLKDWGVESAGKAVSASKPNELHMPPNEIRDAVSALIALGFKPPEASRMVSQVKTEGLASEEIIRMALQAVAKMS